MEKVVSVGKGSVWPRRDGRWGVSLVYSIQDGLTGGIQKKRKATTRLSEEEAEAWLLKTRYGLTQNEAPATPTDTLAAHLDTWLEDVVAPRVAPNTLEKRVWAASNHIVPALGSLRLGDVGARQITSLYSQLSREGYALATRREIHVTLKMALSQAVKWGLIRSNPCDLVDTPRQAAREYREDEEEVRALTDEQARVLFDFTRESRWRNYYIAAIRTGLRPGEALGLRWGDVDLSLDPASLRVRRTLDTHGVARFGPPKSEASRRTVALHYEAADALEEQRRMLAGEGLPAGTRDLVFPSKTGTPMSSNNLRGRYLQPDLKAAGLPKLSLHGLRHTFASIALHEWRMRPAIVQQALGHESMKMTQDLYGHLMQDAQADEMRRLNALYRRSKDVSNR